MASGREIEESLQLVLFAACTAAGSSMGPSMLPYSIGDLSKAWNRPAGWPFFQTSRGQEPRLLCLLRKRARVYYYLVQFWKLRTLK
jgi:hypothetical protein